MRNRLNRNVAQLASASDRECDTGSRRRVVVNQDARVISDLYAIDRNQLVTNLEVSYQGGRIDSVDVRFAFRLPNCVESDITSLLRQRDRTNVQDEIGRHQRQQNTAEQYPHTFRHRSTPV